MEVHDEDDFEDFVAEATPRLKRAFVASRGVLSAGDATAEALGYAWEHWDRVRAMDNPVGYLYRVGQSRTRARRVGMLPQPSALGLPDVEPGLVPALLDLPLTQRTAVWLVHGCGWSYREVAEAMDVSVSAVGTHVTRALERLRAQLEVDARA
ncbi:MAG: sigma factor-like helix-turn-helix DNA-binding protein [Acidimicrobiales bacterium]